MKELLAQELLAQEFMLTASITEVTEKEITDEDFELDIRVANPLQQEKTPMPQQILMTPRTCFPSCNGTCC
ncbi:hypothetical protein EPA93_00940 [Ktedonosporobacter rubrisoli]|uniref:Uncharacterized protein n=1 Tax=Ktedonosporobacter rubrisoli TaxID=2509675 RepID=A0A4V0YY14_KTERU|nr:hypothetical protein [Ktedonosporobacter rubrisoli]QBD74631.1 hypothetical protein EPA93_00940 [Ktedonosporobacter rubrisoli]